MLGAAFGMLAVIAGAFGAHGLEDRLSPKRLETWELASRYQMYHALALLVIGAVMVRLPLAARSSAAWRIAIWLFVIGIVVFCGSLYALALSGHTWLGAITPIGGVGFIGGWVCVLLGARGLR